MRQIIRKFSLTLGLIGLLLPGLRAPVYASGTPQITPSPASQRVQSGDAIKVTLHINPNGTALNTVNVVASYPSDKLEFTGIDKTGAYFDAFIPASPTAQDGKVTFAASALQRGSTSDSVVVASLLFKATSDNGSATVNFDGTQVANGGNAIDVQASNAYVGFDANSGAAKSSVTISGIKISGVTTTGASVSWHTDMPTTGTVDYGSTTKYGFSVNSNDASTDHTVDLGKLFAGKSVVHFQITAVDENSATTMSNDQSFVTLGYPVRITVINNKQQPVSGAQVTVSGHPTVKTGSDGAVGITNVAPGKQNVVAGSGKAQVILVKAALGDAAEKPQLFILKETSNTGIVLLSGLLFVALIIGGSYVIMQVRKNSKKK